MTEKLGAKRLAIFRNRLKSFLDDGYTVIVKSEQIFMLFYKLQHKSNGSIVTFTVYLFRNYMIQKRDGRVVYQGEIIP